MKSLQFLTHHAHHSWFQGREGMKERRKKEVEMILFLSSLCPLFGGNGPRMCIDSSSLYMRSSSLDIANPSFLPFILYSVIPSCSSAFVPSSLDIALPSYSSSFLPSFLFIVLPSFVASFLHGVLSLSLSLSPPPHPHPYIFLPSYSHSFPSFISPFLSSFFLPAFLHVIFPSFLIFYRPFFT